MKRTKALITTYFLAAILFLGSCCDAPKTKFAEEKEDKTEMADPCNGTTTKTSSVDNKKDEKEIKDVKKEPVVNTRPCQTKDTAYVLGVAEYGRYMSRADIRFVKKDGKVVMQEFDLRDKRGCDLKWDKNKEAVFMERGDEIIINRVPANESHDEYWEVLENLATARIKKAWLDEKSK